MVSKSKVRSQLSPGPGHYNASFQTIKQRQGSFKIGTSKKSSFLTKHSVPSPGPGFYQTIDYLGGKESLKVSIMGKPKL